MNMTSGKIWDTLTPFWAPSANFMYCLGVFISGQRYAPADQWLVWAQFEEKEVVGSAEHL